MIHTLTREANAQAHGSNFRSGRVNLNLLKETVPEDLNCHLFVCGPAVSASDKAAAREKGTEPQPRFLESVLADLKRWVCRGIRSRMSRMVNLMRETPDPYDLIRGSVLGCPENAARTWMWHLADAEGNNNVPSPFRGNKVPGKSERSPLRARRGDRSDLPGTLLPLQGGGLLLQIVVGILSFRFFLVVEPFRSWLRTSHDPGNIRIFVTFPCGSGRFLLPNFRASTFLFLLAVNSSFFPSAFIRGGTCAFGHSSSP